MTTDPAPDPSEIEQAARLVQRGGLVAFPTETVYGLGANALDALAVAEVFALKQRPHFDPLIVHIADRDQLDRLVVGISDMATRLIERFWPGPLTLVLPKQDCVPDLVTAGLPTVAVRMPAHPVAQQLIRLAGLPVAAPSANRFGKVSPTTAAHVRDSFGEQAPMVLDAGPCPVGVESTVLSLLGRTPELLRPGGVTREEIEEVIGRVDQVPHGAGHVSVGGRGAGRWSGGEISPGLIASHYAPRIPLRLATSAELSREGPLRPPGDGRWALLCVQAPAWAEGFAEVEILSAPGNLREAAARLFAAVRRLESQPLDGIYAVPIAETGLGAAIMDRLHRAAAGIDP